MKNKILLFIFCLLILISSVRCSCDNNTTKIKTENTTTTEKKKAQKLSQVKNAKIDENYLLTFDKVENAISYEISFDLFDYVDIGNVNSYDLSSCYGSEVAVRAVGDKANYTNSTPVILNLEHYKTVFTSFEGLAGEDEWSGALVGYADILGTTNEKAHTGENSFKIFASNKSTYFGGTLFDTEYYAPYGAIDFQNVKTISYWVYVDTKDLTQIEELCNKYGSHYNADVANFDYFHGYEGHGLLEVFYDESETGTPKTFDEFDNQLYETNKWVKFTFDVSKYKVISDLVLMYGNSDRTFTGNNEPGNWSVTSKYAYIIYYDDIEVEYEPIKLDTVEEILLEDKTFAFTEVENASYYMVTVDGINYTKVTDAEYTVDSLPGMFGVKACNETKYSDGSSRYLESDTKYYIKNNAEKLACVTNLKTIVVDDAVYKNAISWTKNPNAYGYSISTDGINYTYIGDVDTYKVDRIYGVNKIYVKALSNEMNYKDSDSVECKIPNLYNLADFEGDRSYYIGNDNFTAISLSSDSYYGNNSFMIYRTVADCEGMPYARCHVQPELLNNIDFSKVTFVNFYLKVEDIYKGEEQLDCLYNGYASCFLRFRTKNGEIYDTPITGTLEKGKWAQVSVNISSITENNENDPISEIRVYSYLHEQMFNDESTSTDVAVDSSFRVYIDEIVLVYENKINLDEVENKIYSNLDLHNGTVKLNEEINVTKVVLNGDNVDFSVNGNVVTFNNDDCKVLERGKEYLIEVYSNETVYNYVVKTWDIIVSDLDEFNLMLDRLNGNNLVIDGLYLFDNDIDVKNATFGSKPLEYKGTIDGGNHTIYNMTTTNGIGLVKEIKQGGTIRNIAFLNGKGNRVFLLYQNSGIIENVYVEAKVQSDFAWFGTVATVRNDGDNGIVRNCVFNISVDATLSNKGGVLGALYINEDETYQGTIENCYLIKNDSLASVAYIGSNTDIALDSSLFTNVLYFANANDFIKSAVFGSENGWNTTLFNIENDSLLVNGNKVLEYQEYTETYLVIDEKTISVGNIEDEITKVELDNTEKEFTYSNGVITFTDSLLLNKDEIHNIKVYVGENSYLYKAYTLETLVSLDYELLTNTAKLNKGLNNITKVLLDSSSINTIYNEGLLTITSEIDLSTSKSYTLVINADDKVYGFRLTPYDIIVSNATELQEMMTRLNGNNLIAGGRYIFDADIDAKDVVVGTKVLEFTGLIDGRGHIVSNLKANGGVGIVKEIKQSGTIKNIAFINGTGLRCFLVYQNSGTIENVYVEATIPTSWTWYGCVSTIRNDGTNGLIKNCIFNITLPNNQGVGGGVVGALYTGQGSLENCYLLNNNGAEGIVFLGSNGSSTTDISTFTNVYGYTNVKKMLSSISFDENNGWNTSLFKTIDKDLYFGTTKLLEYDKITETYLNKSLKKIAVGEIAGTLEKVTIDGSEANGTYADGFITLEDDVTKETGSYVDVVLTIDSETYSFHAVIQEVEFSNKEFDIYSKTANVGEVLGDIVSCSIDGNTVECTYNNGILTLVGDLSVSSSNSSIIILITSTKAYGYNLTCYDIIVSNATELQEMMNRLNGSKALSNVNGQYIFDADIDASSVTFGTTSIEYTGLIDGRGHIISNLNITGANGFVREIKGAGTIKNLALVNCTAENKVLVHQNSGLIENVYVEATINASDNYAGVVGKISNDGKDGIIRNCVFNVNLQLGIKVDNYYFGIVGYLKVGTVENCYLVNNGSCDRAVYVGTDGSEKDINTLTNVKGYTDINTLIDEATFNNENGWSSDFTNDNSSIKFNGTTLLTKTID